MNKRVSVSSYIPTRFLNRTIIPAACLRKGERNSVSPLNVKQRETAVLAQGGVSLRAGVLVFSVPVVSCGAAVPVCLSELLALRLRPGARGEQSVSCAWRSS